MTLCTHRHGNAFGTIVALQVLLQDNGISASQGGGEQDDASGKRKEGDVEGEAVMGSGLSAAGRNARPLTHPGTSQPLRYAWTSVFAAPEAVSDVSNMTS